MPTWTNAANYPSAFMAWPCAVRRMAKRNTNGSFDFSGSRAADFSKPSIYDVLHADASYEDAIQHLEFFDLIPASEKLSRADREFIGKDDGFILADFVDMIRNDYDFIFVDNAPSRNILLTMTYIASDYIIIPTECD